MTGIGKDDAADIWFRALDVYMSSGATYAQAGTVTLNAAADLFGAGSEQHNAVAGRGAPSASTDLTLVGARAG